MLTTLLNVLANFTLDFYETTKRETEKENTTPLLP